MTQRKDLKERVYKLYHVKGINKMEIAKALDMSYNTVSLYVNPKRQEKQREYSRERYRVRTKKA